MFEARPTPLGVPTTRLPLFHAARGKVRDVYEVDEERLLLVATDRVSAFDVVMREAVPYKGIVLTQLTAWWLRQLEAEVSHHMISADAGEIIAEVPELAPHHATIAGRAMLVKRARIFPIECVIRGYISGSAWKEYSEHGTLAGEMLPIGMAESQQLQPAIFSPATKASTGHDENITIARMRTVVGEERTRELESLTRLVYERGRDVAAERGIIIADTKFEFGLWHDRIILCDEVLTPDSSRFWPADGYSAGGAQPSFDKQPLRDWLHQERLAGRWNGEAPPPQLPDSVVQATSLRYLDAYRRITGTPLDLTRFT
ncbi:MAG TPA: phosphoribosylaminoimidazolesuccinocarboxamide synthase [Gemmatimonadaceae bacterium]|nr:phosphoribosylaminoimidazolesuccinocarboxamide synthase [Gemmatimonadaceae bacterium]